MDERADVIPLPRGAVYPLLLIALKFRAAAWLLAALALVAGLALGGPWPLAVLASFAVLWVCHEWTWLVVPVRDWAPDRVALWNAAARRAEPAEAFAP